MTVDRAESAIRHKRTSRNDSGLTGLSDMPELTHAQAPWAIKVNGRLVDVRMDTTTIAGIRDSHGLEYALHN